MSLRLTLLNTFLRYGVKPRLARMTDPVKARQDLERSARFLFRAPPFSLMQSAPLENGQPALWISNRPGTSARKKQVIFYLHGGGYVAGSPTTHAKMLARLARLTGLQVFAPAYRLAPEHPFPAAFEDAKFAFQTLVAKGYDPSDIIIGGDSAGGGLALALMADLSANGHPPRAVFAFSPLTDMRFQSPSFESNSTRDPLLPAAQKTLIKDMYLSEQSPDDPRASPLLAQFQTPPPPGFLQFSETEILRDDSLRMAEHLEQAGGIVTLDQWPNSPHVWVLFDGPLPEARMALERVAGFINQL